LSNIKTRYPRILVIRNPLTLTASLAAVWLSLILSIPDIPSTLDKTKPIIIIRGTRYFLYPTSNLSRYKKNISIPRLKKL
jgi:hypothetical protein